MGNKPRLCAGCIEEIEPFIDAKWRVWVGDFMGKHGASEFRIKDKIQVSVTPPFAACLLGVVHWVQYTTVYFPF